MPQTDPLLQDLTNADFDKIKSVADKRTYSEGEVIFSEGDEADFIYFIESGRVSVLIQKFSSQEEISTLGPGDYFGEMAFFLKDKRTASVISLTDISLLRVDRKSFLELLKNDTVMAARISNSLARRNEELSLRENLLDITGIRERDLHVSLKGDPSLRETTFTRERYESIVDKVLSLLAPRLEDLLLNRCIYQVYIGFNNGEIRTSSIFDPYTEEMHQADRMADEAYIDRHFPLVPYEEKVRMIQRMYVVISGDPLFKSIPGHFSNIFSRFVENWRPLSKTDITNTISQLPALRSIPNYYLRNITIGMTRNAIRMQFNCDGTHIVSAENYLRFIEENL